MVLCAVALGVASIRLFLSEDGDDRNPGRSSRKPIRSLTTLVDRVKEIRRENPDGPIEIQVRGTIRTSAPVALGPEFRHVRIFGLGKAAISGGIPLGTARPGAFNGHSCWDVEVPSGITPHQLFANGRRLDRTRLPDTGFYQFAGYLNGEEKSDWMTGQSAMTFQPGDLDNWSDLADVEIVAHHLWVTSILPIRSVNLQTHTVEFTRPSVFKLNDDYTGKAAVYAVYSAAAGFRRPGQWYFERAKGVIHYIPLPDEKISDWKPIVPVATQLFAVNGVKNLIIENLKFEHTDWQYPANQSGDPQAATSVPGAITFDSCDDCVVRKCSITGVGTYALEVTKAGKNNRFDHVAMSDLGGGGVKIGHDTSSTTVQDCTIEHGGRLFAPAIGIWIGNSGQNVIDHNTIHDLFYTGISVGWTWGYGPSNAVANQITNNDISQIGQGELSDMGGIYTLGISPGTVLRGNRIDNVRARGYGGWGIYTDEGSTGILIENNIVTNTKTGGFHQHYGRENVIRNNIFAYASQDGQVIRSRQEDHPSFTFAHNVVLWKGTPLLGGNWSNGHFAFGPNLLFREDGEVILPPGDQGSVVAKSLRLSKTWMPSKSDAAKVGFTPFKLSAGARK